MAVAFDAVSNVAAGTGNLSWTHTPVGTPRGVKVDIVENGGTNGVSSVTYGGVAMELASVNNKTSGEAGTVITYFLGRGIPTGAQTVSVTVSDAVSKRAVATTVTASTNTCWISTDISIGSDSLANPASTLNLLGKTCFVSLAGHSGQNAVTGTTQLTGWTSRLEHAFGTACGAWYSYNTIAATNVSCGWTQTADDAVMVALAITESPLCTENHPIGFTESASVAVIFDSRAIPVKITESAVVTILTSVSASDGVVLQLSESASLTNLSITTTDSLSVAGSESSVSTGIAFSVSDTSSVQFSSESSSKTTSSSTALQALPIPLTDTASITAISQNVSDQFAPQFSEVSTVSSTTPSFTVSDSLNIAASESSVVPFPYAIEANGITLTESRPVITAQGGELVLLVADSTAVTISESVSNIFVFIPGATQNFVVSDSMRVALNGSGQIPVSKTASESLLIAIVEPQDQTSTLGVIDSLTVQASDTSSVNTGSTTAFFSVSDSVRVSLSDVSNVFANTILTVSDSIKVLTVEDVPDVVTALICSDSLRVTVTEPNDQYSQIGVLDGIAVQAVTESLQIGGLLSFSVNDSFVSGLTESSSFGSCAVGASDTTRIVVSDALSNSAAVSAFDGLGILTSDLSSLVKSISIADTLITQLSDSASPIFNNFVAITASDSCSLQISESVTNLVSFLAQLTASDTLTAQVSESATDQFLATFASDQVSAIEIDIPDIFNPISITESLTAGTSEAGLAIPIVPVGVSTFADDPIPVLLQDESHTTAQQPTVEDVVASLLDSVFIDRSLFVTDTHTCRITEQSTIFAIVSAADDLSIATSDNSTMTVAYNSNDSVIAGCTDHTNGYAVVANSSPDTWNGSIVTEHRNNKPKPWKYIFSDKLNW